MPVSHKRGERGYSTYLFVTMLVTIVGAAGLAVDVGTIYMIKSRLSAAVDAAALAAGRSVNLANSVAQATTNATTMANQFFAANFPTGYFNTIGAPTVNPSFAQETDANGNPTGVLDVTVTASVQAPTYFMNVFGVHNVTVSNSGTASRRGVVLMLVLDQSSSMNTAPDPVTGLTACQAMKQAAQNFITLFSPFDTIGLVTFDLTAHLPYPPSQNWSDGTLNTDLGNITCGSNTNTISALELAYQELKAVGLPLAENTVVLFTDGSPNGISATFPIRAVADNRWGPAGTAATGYPAPPAQSGSTYGIANNCTNVGSNEAICNGMPVICTDSTATVTGAMSQTSGQNSYGGTTYGLAQPSDYSGVQPSIAYSNPSWPATCSNTTYLQSHGDLARQYIAYIPNTDIYGNSLTGIPASGTSPYGTIVSGYDTRSYWLFQTNSLCSPDPNVSPNCKNTGGPWSGFPSVGSGSNFFPTGSTYAGYFRPDQPNSIVAASMNGTMAAANTIRSDTTYHPIIHVIYLTGNGSDSVDREFLPIVANYPTIPALPYDPVGYTPYTNPAYQTSQETGRYFVTADRNQLTSLFAQLASEVLRLSK
jgi:Flp pilus assembly protein TadG